MSMRSLLLTHPGDATLVLFGMPALWMLLGLLRGGVRWTGRRCAGCRYALAGPLPARCPECGAALHLAGATHVGIRALSPRHLVGLTLLAAVAWPARTFVEGTVGPLWLRHDFSTRSIDELEQGVLGMTRESASPPSRAGTDWLMERAYCRMEIHDRIDAGALTAEEALEAMLRAAGTGRAEQDGRDMRDIVGHVFRLASPGSTPAQLGHMLDRVVAPPVLRWPGRVRSGALQSFPAEEEFVGDNLYGRVFVTGLRIVEAGASAEEAVFHDDRGEFQWPSAGGAVRVELDWEQRVRWQIGLGSTAAWTRAGTRAFDVEVVDESVRPPGIVDAARRPWRREDLRIRICTLERVQYAELRASFPDDDRLHDQGRWFLRQAGRRVSLRAQSGMGTPRYAAIIDPPLDPMRPVDLVHEPDFSEEWTPDLAVRCDGIWAHPLVIRVENDDLVTIGP